jgi:hypothetical protein
MRILTLSVVLAVCWGCTGGGNSSRGDVPAVFTEGGLLTSTGTTYTAYFGENVLTMAPDLFLTAVTSMVPYTTVGYWAVSGSVAALTATPQTFNLSNPAPFTVTDTIPVEDGLGYVFTFTPGMPGVTGEATLSWEEGGLVVWLWLYYEGTHPVDGSLWRHGIHAEKGYIATPPPGSPVPPSATGG